MKRDLLEPFYLRRGLRGHPDVAQHVANLDDIERMASRTLLSLARKLNVDVAAMIKGVQERDAEQQQHSHKFPAFDGTLEFELTIELFGKRITRKARAKYTHTPEWEYLDLRKNAPYVGWPGSSLDISIRTVPNKDGTNGGPAWEGIDVLNIGEIWNVLDDAIEERCKIEDAKRRSAAAGKRRK